MEGNRMKNKGFAERLRMMIDRHSEGVVRRFAADIQTNHQAVFNWLAGERLPGAKSLEAMWTTFGIDPLWLLTGEHRTRGPVTLGVAAPQVPAQAKKENAAFVAEEVRRDRFVTVPLLADAIAGGSPRRVNADDIEDYALIHADWCPHPEHVTCVRVRGDSMSPILTDGSIVAIDHGRRNPKQLDGKMVAFRQGDGASVKWCKVVSKDLVMGLPENKDSLAADSLLLFQGDDIDDCIIGCVLWWWGRPE